MIKIQIIVLLFFSSLANAEIREIQTMKDLEKIVQTNDIVVFDIDNTILTPTQTLGSDQWYGYLVKTTQTDLTNNNQNSDKLSVEKQAIEKAIEQWMEVQKLTRMIPVEKNTPKFIRRLQKKGLLTIALTARPVALSTVTLNQLKSIGVQFNIASSLTYKSDLSDVIFSNGILFVGPNNNKGIILADFLDKLQMKPNRIIFVDDKLKHVTNMDAVFKEKLKNINFRYGYLDKNVSSFSDKLADVQHKVFVEDNIIISDEDAKELLIEQQNRAPSSKQPTHSKKH